MRVKSGGSMEVEVEGGEGRDELAEANRRRLGSSPEGKSWFKRASPAVAATLTVILVVLAGILVVNNGSIRFEHSVGPQNPIIVPIDAIERQISYRGPWTGYEGPAVNDSCIYCPFGAQEGSAIRLPIATWYLPQNVSIWIYTNVSGTFPVQAPGCSPAPCVFPWLKVWSYETFVQKGVLLALTLFATFELPDNLGPPFAAIYLNATFCPVPVCAPPP